MFRFRERVSVAALCWEAREVDGRDTTFHQLSEGQEMSATVTTTEHTFESVLDVLERFHQRATYGAVAGVVDSSPRSLMTGRPRDLRHSWVVSRQNGQPTGYPSDQIDPALESRERILGSPDELRGWLADPG